MIHSNNYNSSCWIVACSIFVLLCSLMLLVDASRWGDDGRDSNNSKKYNGKKKHDYGYYQEKYDDNDYRDYKDNTDIQYIYYTEPPQTPTVTTVETLPIVTDVVTITSDQVFTHTEEVTVSGGHQYTTTTTATTTTTTIPIRPGSGGVNAGERSGNAVDQCDWNGSDNVTQTIRYFNTIVFGNYYTSSAQEIYGPLGIQGDFSGNDYTVNAQHSPTCADLSTSDLMNFEYGLVVDGITNVVNTKVHGASFLDEGGTTDQVAQLDNGCPKTTGTTGGVDFDALRKAYLLANQELASFPPNVVLSEDDVLTVYTVLPELAGTTNYNVMAMATCSIISGDRTCNLFPGYMSDPNHMLLGQGNWNGPASGEQIPSDKTFVINVPVDDGGTITLKTNHPTQGGLNACNTIWNFYPVDADGNYDPNGSFTLRRETAGELYGLTLAPLGRIEDSSIGSFSGQVIGLDYGWEGGNSVAVKDYESTGCGDHFTGCLPIIPNNNEPTSECTTTTTIDVISTIHDTTTTTATNTETDIATVYTVSVSVSTETDIVTSIETDTTTEITTTTETQGSIGTITRFEGTTTTTKLSTTTEETTETDTTTTTQETTETTTNTETITDHDTTTSTTTVYDTVLTGDNNSLTGDGAPTGITVTVTRTLIPTGGASLTDISYIVVTETQQDTTTEYLPGATTTEHDHETVYVPIEVPVPGGDQWYNDDGDDDGYYGGRGNGYHKHRGHSYGSSSSSKDGWNKKKEQHYGGGKKNKKYDDEKKEWSHKQKYNPGYNDYY